MDSVSGLSSERDRLVAATQGRHHCVARCCGLGAFHGCGVASLARDASVVGQLVAEGPVAGATACEQIKCAKNSNQRREKYPHRKDLQATGIGGLDGHGASRNAVLGNRDRGKAISWAFRAVARLHAFLA